MKLQIPKLFVLRSQHGVSICNDVHKTAVPIVATIIP